MSASAREAATPRAAHLLTATGPSRRGQVAALCATVDRIGGYIEELDQYDDPDTQRFFARLRFHVPDTGFDAAELSAERTRLAEAYGLTVRLAAADRPVPVLILVSRLDHCLRDLLYRHARGELSMTIAAIASNHADLEPLAAQYGCRFVHLPVSRDTRGEQEAALQALVAETGAELVILARYMQILSDEMALSLAGRAINIHHSFLPGFKGAKPYHRAHARGVKQIGATAHYVTPDLDEGPIIEQSVARVRHDDRVGDLIATGRDCECRALSHAVRMHIESRVFINGERTLVFG
ncbi:formyltetrahydrofolate deformylase [Salinisphaera sp. Q1T1-3]|uniref:formyltetrahydrofolate deformylase n=1 Tax=Salinisphaera sp. Q1T1-3 TaxID=2321229 RepID=UPI000E71A6A2|nr:formyltetrahydrofolate deformylase [Salinisphaera sp. Q1T1-3]RJS94408.1 formyltetrahydrofolate deformylase [Salinisphaera sp. Q1T1-3]